MIRNMPVSAFILMQLYQYNKGSSLSCATLKSYLIMRVKWGWHGRVLVQQLSCAFGFFLNCSHLLQKKLDTRQDGHLLCNFVCIWPLKLNNKLGKNNSI